MPAGTQGYSISGNSIRIPFGSPLSTTAPGGMGMNASYGSAANQSPQDFWYTGGLFGAPKPAAAASPVSQPSQTSLSQSIQNAVNAALGKTGQGPAAANPLSNTPGGLYTPPNTNHVQNYLQNLLTGGSVNPNTGWEGSAAQVMGKAGGSMQDYMAHHGILDPVSAQAAIKQYQGLSQGQLQGINVNNPNWYKDLVSGQPSAPTAPAAASGPSQNSPFAPGQQQQMELQSALNKAAESLLYGGGKPDPATLATIAQGQSQPGFADALKNAMGFEQAQKAVNSEKPPGAVSFINGQWYTGPPQAPAPAGPADFAGGAGSTTPQQALAGWANLGNQYTPNAGGGGIQIVNGKPTWVGPPPTLKK